jgi:hypothetical protein
MSEPENRAAVMLRIEEAWRKLWPADQQLSFDWSDDPLVRPMLRAIIIHKARDGYDYHIMPHGDDRYLELVIEGQNYD